jgi:hypothetical protein
MKFLITMNMPSAQGYAVHQVTVEHPVENLDAFCDLLNDNEFILCRQLYRQKNMRGDSSWLDRGDIVINTYHIGKVQQFIEFERENDDESFGYSEGVGSHVGRQRPPLRKRGGDV